MSPFRRFAIVALLPAMAWAQSFNYKAIGAAPAVMYDAPSHQGSKRFIAPAGMPVEVVHVSGNWSKVRDAAGDMTWVETKAIGNRHAVVVTAASAKIRGRADNAAPLVFTAAKGVLLDVAEPVVSGWIKVRHRDGQAGYVRSTEVWGG